MSDDVLSKELFSLKMGKLSYIEMLDGKSIGSVKTSILKSIERNMVEKK